MEKKTMFEVAPSGRDWKELVDPDEISNCRVWRGDGKEDGTVFHLKNGHKVIIDQPFEKVKEFFNVIEIQ